MDPRRFDRVVAIATSRPSRRSALRLLVGGAIAGVLPAVFTGFQRSARAQERIFDVALTTDVIEVGAISVVATVFAEVSDLVPEGSCPAPLVDCENGYGCVDLSNSASNCGACGNACLEGDFCWSGQCYTPAAPGNDGAAVTPPGDGGVSTGAGGGGGGGVASTCDPEYKAEFGDPPIAESTCEGW